VHPSSLRPSDPMKAIAWMMGALVSFLVMAVSVRELGHEMHAFQMLFVRSAIGVAILAAVLSIRGWAQVRTQRLDVHLGRNLVHFAGQSLWIVGISLLPLATVAAIEFTVPIWGIFLTVLFLGERMNRGRWISLASGILGILVILRPGVAVIGLGALLMLGCTFCFGATNAITKWLTRADSPLTIVFYMVLMQTVIGALATVFVWTPIGASDWPFLLLLGVTGVSAHYALTHAFAAADATFIMPFEFLRLPFVALVGFLVYAEDFEAAVLIGAALIFAGNYVSLRQESRRLK
jgi:drug/metabolite transporter (DMT)-like permease